jgi:hypothetical protein
MRRLKMQGIPFGIFLGYCVFYDWLVHINRDNLLPLAITIFATLGLILFLSILSSSSHLLTKESRVVRYLETWGMTVPQAAVFIFAALVAPPLAVLIIVILSLRAWVKARRTPLLKEQPPQESSSPAYEQGYQEQTLARPTHRSPFTAQSDAQPKQDAALDYEQPQTRYPEMPLPTVSENWGNEN